MNSLAFQREDIKEPRLKRRENPPQRIHCVGWELSVTPTEKAIVVDVDLNQNREN
jgi:hypothetical protein